MADTINVKAPDGSMVAFPAGTSDETINRAMNEANAAGVFGKSLRASIDAGPAQDDPGPSVMRTVAQTMRAASNGLTFNNTDRIAAGINALIGNGDYASNLEGQRKESNRFTRDYPFTNSAANVVGGSALPFGVVGAAANRVTALGRTLAGLGTGAIMGGLSGAGASPDWTDLPQLGKDTAVGMGLGAAIGGAIPGGAAAIGKAYNKASNWMVGGAHGMSSGASKYLVPALEADGPATVKAELGRLGPDAMLADTGFALQGTASGAALNNPAARSIAFKNLRERDAGTNARVQKDVNEALGPAEDPQTVRNAIVEQRAAVDSQNYPPALAAAPDVRTAPILQQLGNLIPQSVGMERRALENLRDMMMTTERRRVVDAHGYPMFDARGHERFEDVPVSQNNAEVLHKVKQELDNVIQYDAPGLGLPAGALSRQQAMLKILRHQLNGALEEQVPGYREANRASAALAQRAEAVQGGTQYLGSGKTTPSPQRFADEFDPLSPGEKIAFAKGSRGEIERMLGTKANDLQALRGELQGEGGWNTAKLATVHGQDAADDLIASVDRNLRFRDTHNKVVENAQTAQRTAAKEAMAPSPPNDLPDLIGPGTTTLGLLSTAGKRAAGYIYRGLLDDPTRHYPEIASIVTAKGPQADAFREALEAAISRRQAIDAHAPAVGNGAALAISTVVNGLLQDRRARQSAN